MRGQAADYIGRPDIINIYELGHHCFAKPKRKPLFNLIARICEQT
jgi:hypothetical protein